MNVSARLSHPLWRASIVCWMFAVPAVWLWTVRYEFATESPAESYSPPYWPSETSLERDPARPTLVFFVHPKCPCTRATVRELEKLLSGSGLRSEEQPRLLILASRPLAVPDTWHDTDILRKASALPQAELVLDGDGREAGRFGAISSGTVMLFDPAGRRLFAGGVTGSRGHEGDNAGRDALAALLSGQADSEVSAMPAFGCRLCLPDQYQKEHTGVAKRDCPLCKPEGTKGEAE